MTSFKPLMTSYDLFKFFKKKPCCNNECYFNYNNNLGKRTKIIMTTLIIMNVFEAKQKFSVS